MQNTFHLKGGKNDPGTSARKYWYLFSPFSFLDVLLTAHLSFSFGLLGLGLAAGNLRLTFGQFAVHVRNYITARSPFPSGEREITLSIQFPVGVRRCEVMSDVVRLPANPHPTLQPSPEHPPSLCPAPPELAL